MTQVRINGRHQALHEFLLGPFLEVLFDLQWPNRFVSISSSGPFLSAQDNG